MLSAHPHKRHKIQFKCSQNKNFANAQKNWKLKGKKIIIIGELWLGASASAPQFVKRNEPTRVCKRLQNLKHILMWLLLIWVPVCCVFGCVSECLYGSCVRQCWLPCAAFAMYDTARYSQQHRKNTEDTTKSLAIDLETGKVFLQSWKFACKFLKRRGLVCRWIAWLSCLATHKLFAILIFTYGVCVCVCDVVIGWSI